jgi:hypothetical protein
MELLRLKLKSKKNGIMGLKIQEGLKKTAEALVSIFSSLTKSKGKISPNS